MPHTAEHIDASRRAAIAVAIANGESRRSIARRLKTSEHIVAIVSDEDWQRVASHKERLAAQAERNALMAGEQLTEALEKRTVPIGSLVPVYGVSLDKCLALRGDQVSTIRHIHSIDIQDDDLVAFAVQRSQKRANAIVIDSPPISVTNLNALPEPIAPAKPSARKRRRKAGGTNSSNPIVGNQALK